MALSTVGAEGALDLEGASRPGEIFLLGATPTLIANITGESQFNDARNASSAPCLLDIGPAGVDFLTGAMS